MPGPIFVTVANGQSVSSAFAIDHPATHISIEVPSFGTGASVNLHFTSTSGGGAFLPLMREDGSALPYAVLSGTGGGWGVVRYPSPFGRISLGATQSAIMSFTILPKR